MTHEPTSTFEPRWDEKTPTGIWMGDYFFEARRLMAPGSDRWDDRPRYGPAHIFFDVDVKKYDWLDGYLEVIVTQRDDSIYVHTTQEHGPDEWTGRNNTTMHMAYEYFLDDGLGWVRVARHLGALTGQFPEVGAK